MRASGWHFRTGHPLQEHSTCSIFATTASCGVRTWRTKTLKRIQRTLYRAQKHLLRDNEKVPIRVADCTIVHVGIASVPANWYVDSRRVADMDAYNCLCPTTL